MRAEILVPVAMRTFQMSRTSLSSRMWHDAIHQLGCFAGLECLLCHVIDSSFCQTDRCNPKLCTRDYYLRRLASLFQISAEKAVIVAAN